MHRFPSKSLVVRFRLSALLYIARFLLLIVGFPMLLWSMLMDEGELFLLSIGFLAAFPLVAVAQWMMSSGLRCPLCLAHPLIHRSCVKNRRAVRLLGSYRLRVAVTSLFLGYFRCQYCGEPTEMKARERRRHIED